MVTIKDVADLANVSIATVSRVLNQTGYVSPELDQRVRQAIAQLGYQRNALARNLRRSESLTLGMVIPDSTNPFFAEMAKGVEDVCFSNGLTVVLCNTNENPEREATYFNALYQQRVAGFIVVSTGQATPHLQQLLAQGYPIVVVDRPIPGLETDVVTSDNYGGAREAIHHLLKLGHRRIGFIAGDKHLETIKLRWQGVHDALREYGLTAARDLIYNNADFLPQSGYAAAEALLARPEPPTAIFAFNDLMAFGVLNYAQTHGIAVPQQLSVVGFDDIVMSSYAGPGLTTVTQQKYELGRTVTELLVRRLQGGQDPPVNIIMPAKLMVRGTTAAIT